MRECAGTKCWPSIAGLFSLPQTANGNVEAKVVCLFRRRDISGNLNTLADSNASECRLPQSSLIESLISPLILIWVWSGPTMLLRLAFTTCYGLKKPTGKPKRQQKSAFVVRRRLASRPVLWSVLRVRNRTFTEATAKRRSAVRAKLSPRATELA